MSVKGKHLLHLVQHGINSKTFRPMEKYCSDLVGMRKKIFNGKEYDFVIFNNNRNINRKRQSDIILAYRVFCDNLTKEQSDKCLLMFHTEAVSDAGTDFRAVKKAIIPNYNFILLDQRFSPEDMNLLYNLCDVTVNNGCIPPGYKVINT